VSWFQDKPVDGGRDACSFDWERTEKANLLQVVLQRYDRQHLHWQIPFSN
jgi:hypothetical protein